MDAVLQTLKRVEVSSAKELKAWFAKHHALRESVLLVTYKKAVPDKYVSREAVLDALIAWGWVDGRMYKLNDEKVIQLIAPRNPQKPWTAWYRERVARLVDSGEMRAPGLKLVRQAKKNNLWHEDAKIEDLALPVDLMRGLRSSSTAFSYFSECPDSYVRNVLRWLESPKAATTRMKRMQKVIEFSERGARIPQM